MILLREWLRMIFKILLENGCILTPDTENTPDDADTLKITRLPFNTQMQSGAFLTLKAMDKVQRKYFNLEGFKPFLSVYDSLVLFL